MGKRPLHVRVMRVAFWASAAALATLVAALFLAFIIWLLIVNWQVLGL